MARENILIKDINLGKIFFDYIELHGNSLDAIYAFETKLTLTETGSKVRIEEPVYRGIHFHDENLSAEGAKTFETATLHLDDPPMPGSVPLTAAYAFDQAYADSFVEVDKLVKFAADFFNKRSDATWCKYASNRFCAATERFDKTTGAAITPASSTWYERKENGVELIVNLEDTATPGIMDAADTITIDISRNMFAPVLKIKIRGDSPYARLFRIPFLQPASSTP